MDHYLGEEGVQNILSLRFANTAYEPLWNRHHVKSVLIDFKEEFGAEVLLPLY
jgi:glucose-6-phosphate 1-dehydrogenase